MDWTNEEYNLDRDELFEVTRHVSDIARDLFSAATLIESMQAVIILAKETIEGCDHASLFLMEDGIARAPIQTDPVVFEIDILQYVSGEGPSLDAMTHRLVFYANDLFDDLRWPSFAPLASLAGIRSALALPMAEGLRLGALNLYSRFPDAFGVFDRAKAAILASLANVALTLAQYHEDSEDQTHNLGDALKSRDIIGQAKGILMEREQITSDAAFEILRRASEQLNMKTQHVAQILMDTGRWPSASSPFYGND